MSPVEVSVLVPVLNEQDNIARSVASMQAQRFAGEIEFIFADGQSRDATRAILDRLAAADPRIIVLENPQRRTPHGLNLCLARASGRYVARMDGHAHYPSDYLERGVRRLERGDVAWVAGPQLARGEGWWSSRVTLALQSGLGRGGSQRWSADEETALSCASGVFLGVWRRSVLERLGGWDEGWPVNQDVELAGRIEAAGERIVSLAPMGARYIPRNTPLSLARQYGRYGFYRVKTSRRHPQALRASHLGTPALVGTLTLAALPLPDRSPPAARALRRGARGLGVAYAAGLVAIGSRAARHPADRLLVPAALAVMHLSWGAGFLAGCGRLGLPLAGLRRVARETAGFRA